MLQACDVRKITDQKLLMNLFDAAAESHNVDVLLACIENTHDPANLKQMALKDQICFSVMEKALEKIQNPDDLDEIGAKRLSHFAASRLEDRTQDPKMLAYLAEQSLKHGYRGIVANSLTDINILIKLSLTAQGKLPKEFIANRINQLREQAKKVNDV